MSSQSRAASAVSSRNVKQQLVRLLFGAEYSGKGREAHRMLDHSVYSYADLKTAYLERMQRLHPDKTQSTERTTMEREADKRKFVELQDAWNRYENLAKMMKRVEKGGTTEASFTMFGVGCSFSDNEEERAFRNEITDQACRGWFSAGLLEEATYPPAHDTAVERHAPLLDDSLFIPQDEQSQEASEIEAKHSEDKSSSSQRSLVSHLIRSKSF